ncbi:MAG: formylmethanofuran dehydrogenase subunit E family protein, partial [Bacillota bacterium]|nr:formylmethanofuran dehydrogenase subunit E family protein [Bacillota bacterium]
DFHGHTCPEISVGFRVAQIAMRELGIRPTPSSELTVTASTHSCALDAFQILNRATYGRGNLRVNETKEHVYHFQYTGTEEGILISIQPEILTHLAEAHVYTNAREKQNKFLEAIQFILRAEEAQFCTLKKTTSPLASVS